MEQTRLERPLVGVRVLVPRARAQAQEICDALEHTGANPVPVPVIEFAPPLDAAPMQHAIDRVADYQWIVFTSANGVEFFFAGGLDPADMKTSRFAAIGPATADALRTHGIDADLVPERSTDEALVDALIKRVRPDDRVLLPRAELADDSLPHELREAGATVDAITAYRSLPPDGLAQSLRTAFANTIHAVTFTSPSTITNTLTALGAERGYLDDLVMVSIGPTTSRAAHEAGVPVHAEATEQSAQGLVDALVNCWQTRKSEKRTWHEQ